MIAKARRNFFILLSVLKVLSDNVGSSTEIVVMNHFGGNA